MKTKGSMLVVIGTLVLLGNFRSFADEIRPPVSLDNNPYIELYKLRIIQAETNVKRQEALVTLANQRLDRTRRLVSKGASTQEDLDVSISDAGVATADLELARKKVDESKTYFRIVEALVKRGISIPLCTYEME